MTEFHTASTWKRVFAFWIDSLISGLFLAPMWFPFIKSMVYQDEVVFISWGLIVLCVGLRLLWDIACLYFLGATPGKLALGLKVISVGENSPKLSPIQCVLRVLADQLSFFFGIAPRAFLFLRLDRRHLSDWVAETKVVQGVARPNPPERRVILAIFLILFGVFGRMAEVYRLFQQVVVSTSGISAVQQPR